MTELSPLRRALSTYGQESLADHKHEFLLDTRFEAGARAFMALRSVLDVIEEERQGYDDYNGALDPGDHMVLELLDKLDAALKEALES